MGGKKRHEHLSRDGFVSLAPDISRRGLKGGFRFMDAQVDDSRLTLRLIDESVQDGAAALNYTSVRRVNRDRANRVVGVTAQDVETGLTRDLLSKAVINATGAWAENFSPYPDRKKSLRPLRGSHLIIPSDILNLRDSISFNHPGDNRPLYLCPWEGAIILGTTDIDHDEDLMKAPSITREEISYLLEGFRTYFPSVNLSMDKAVSTFAGIRPVLSEGDRLASQESREHEVWSDNGLITVTGGKLTTFRRLAWDTLNEAAPYLGGEIKLEPDPSVFKQATIKNKAQVNVSADILRRILGRYGQAGEEIFSEAQEQDLSEIPGTNSIWAELPFVCRREQVRKLSDLLLRRVRIGLLCPEGARNHMPRIRKLCMAPLNWDDEKWRRQEIDYLESWQQAHGVQSNPSEMQMDK
jgi:glycerol-3-phosphate dehydrogenase